jgi:predicted porin
MKKSLLALAALTAFAGAASAQSSVTLYGRVDLSVGKGFGTDAKSMANGSGSRFGVRGVEDLGGGLSALFNIEHRFDADTGSQGASRFWHGRSLVGLQGGFGQVVFGREYVTAFLQSQLVADPWGWDTIVAGSLGGTVGLNTAITGGAIAKVRNDSSVTYKVSTGGVTFGAQIAEATDAINNFQSRPVNFAVNYSGGPLVVGFGYERTGLETATITEKWMTLNASYDFGMAKVGAMIGRGEKVATGASGAAALAGDHKSYLVSVTAPVGAGELRASYGRLENTTINAIGAKGFALGYHYSLSKRTTIYADVAKNDSDLIPASASKTGYDFGIKHNF